MTSGRACDLRRARPFAGYCNGRWQRLMHAVCLMLALCLPAALCAEGRAIIVLDASGSMWDPLEGRPKLEIAREALNAVLQVLPADVELGLLAYGHREKGNCNDIELIVPPATGRASAISTAAEFMNFIGKTPLTAAVRQAAAALDSENRQATVVLITDGVDNCSGDPCALATELESKGTNFTVHVVGFGLNTAEAAEVACLARDTGGSYLQADDLETLTLALQDTVLVPDTGPSPSPSPSQPVPQPDPQPTPTPNPAPAPDPSPVPTPVPTIPNFEPRVLLSAAGPAVPASDAVGFSLQPLGNDGAAQPTAAISVHNGETFVPPGRYRMVTTLGAVSAQQDIIVPDAGFATPDVIMNAAFVTLTPRIAPQATIEAETDMAITGASGFSLRQSGEIATWLPAGDLTLIAQLDAVTTTMPLRVVAGQPLQQDVFISAAVIVPKVFYTDSQPVNAAELRIDIVGARPNADGSRIVFSTRTSSAPVFHLGAGDYVAITTLGMTRVETPFSIALVQRTDLPIILNAGVLIAAAAGADMIRISPPPDIAGNAPTGTDFASDSVLETLIAGEYQVQARFGDATATANVTIKPGERTEVTLVAP